jgi:hypothetical protein
VNLPVRVQDQAGSEPVISVDGAWGAPGLNLSHWPGNSTPADLKRELSTGIALAFSRLDAADQAARSAGCVALCNNHYDTDGVCAMLALADPQSAWRHEEALLAAARAGDFFQVPSEAAFVIDAIVTGLTDTQRSPWSARFQGLSDRARHELCTLEVLERLPGWLAGDVDEFKMLWEPRLADLRADLADLSALPEDDLVHLSLSVWQAAPGARSSRSTDSPSFDPGRHALFGSRATDRQLVIGPGASPGSGATYRFLIGTLSWFDLPGPTPPPRPDLVALGSTLNELEGTQSSDTVSWQHQSPSGASPELWFGTSEFAPFSQHAQSVLMSSALEPTTVKTAVVDALRAAWVFPDADDETDLD